MTTVETQLHGYRQGHQLIDSSIQLSKSDQSVIDRLSDVAGPLRPGERFEPYLSVYPLPSDRFCVFARTWQDFTVPRDGCVRTLSIIIPADDWQAARDLRPFLDLLNPEAFPSRAAPAQLGDTPSVALPQAPDFRASELLEALFLEDSKPVALFDAPTPELIAIRLLSALWPALRRRFKLSTFALSPRKIEGQYFDLVFAPMDARSRFADWPGRRVDARAGKTARHRWTGEIVNRVFQCPVPWLLDDREIRLIGEYEGGTPAALRIALLWDELLAKLDRSPSAALGLIDIANSKMQSGSAAVLGLQPALASAAQHAVATFPSPEAWEFLGAMARKIYNTPLAPTLPSVSAAAGVLTGRSPGGAIALLDQADEESAISAMVPAIAASLTAHYGNAVEQALEDARLPTFTRLMVADLQLARHCLESPKLVEQMAQSVVNLEPALFSAFRDQILTAIIDERHVVLARPLFASLDVDGLCAEVKHLNAANQFGAKSLLPPLIGRARELSAVEALRSTLVSIATSPGREQFLSMTLSPVADDLWWLLQEPLLSNDEANRLVQGVICQANTRQFRDLFASPSLAPMLIERLAGRRDLLLRAAIQGQLPLALRVQVVFDLFPGSPESQKQELATSLLEQCLRSHFGGNEEATLSALLAILETSLDGGWVVRTGLGRMLSASIINRNIVAFNGASAPARKSILAEIEELADGLALRVPLDLDENAARAYATLLWDAQFDNFMGLLHSAGRLLPILFQSGQAPVSAIVAATFPFIYRELAKEDDVPDIFKFIPFIDWDRCKPARRKLVEAFLSSDLWHPGDLALTACRALDVEKILRRAEKSDQSGAYIRRVASDLRMLPDSCRNEVEHAIALIQSDRSAK